MAPFPEECSDEVAQMLQCGRPLRSRSAIAGLSLALLLGTAPVVVVLRLQADSPAGNTGGRQARPETAAYDEGARGLTDDQRLGRDTWYFWTAGNEAFWRRLAVLTSGNVDVLMYVDSRRHDRRFETLGVINTPGCVAATSPDRYGLWLDDCSQAGTTASMPGTPE